MEVNCHRIEHRHMAGVYRLQVAWGFAELLCEERETTAYGARVDWHTLRLWYFGREATYCLLYPVVVLQYCKFAGSLFAKQEDEVFVA